MDTMMGAPMQRSRWHWIKKIIFLIILVVILICWCYGQQFWMSMNAKGYQSVFLTNGQVYFGKVSTSGRWIKLTDIYYLQVTQPLQQASSESNAAPQSTGTAANNQPNSQLIKLGSELHGPTDAMYIEKDKVLFWENMKDDSKVVSAIKQYKSK